MLTTGMLMLGKMSVGVRKIATIPMTTNVEGRRNANLTIHIACPENSFDPLCCADLLRLIWDGKRYRISATASVATAVPRPGNHCRIRRCSFEARRETASRLAVPPKRPPVSTYRHRHVERRTF